MRAEEPMLCTECGELAAEPERLRCKQCFEAGEAWMAEVRSAYAARDTERLKQLLPSTVNFRKA
jgi:hypothetical protein